MTKVTHIVVHYSATYADQDLTVKDIDKMHRERGWQMVGYHYVIRRDGTIERGRPESMVGAHVGNRNTGKIGICCIGGLERATGPNKGVDNRTPQQVESLIKLIRDILKRHPGAQVVGHRDLAPTQCPGFDVPAWWDTTCPIVALEIWLKFAKIAHGPLFRRVTGSGYIAHETRAMARDIGLAAPTYPVSGH